MKETVKDMMRRIHDRIENEMPEEGFFEPLAEGFDNPDARLVADRYWLRVAQAPKGIEGHGYKRGLYFHASKDGDMHASVHILMSIGNKEKLLEELQSDALLDALLEQTGNLSYHMTDLC